MNSIVVVGLARDCCASLPGMHAFFHDLRSRFDSTAFVIVENDSRDATRAALESWKAGLKSLTIIDGDRSCSSLDRTFRLATCRNIAMEYVAVHHKECRLMLVIDMDLQVDMYKAEKVLRASEYLMSKDEAVGVFPNSTPLYYDIFALRHPIWCPVDAWQEAADAASSGLFQKIPPPAVYIYSRQLYIRPSTDPIEVLSAFGGMGLYKFGAAVLCRYGHLDTTGRSTCEHVIFNSQLQGKLFVLPWWIVKAPSIHLSSYFRGEYSHERALRHWREPAATWRRRLARWLG